MKKLFHITEDISRASGGVRTVVLDLYRYLSNAVLLTTRSDKNDVEVVTFNATGPWLYSKSLKNYLENTSPPSIFHLHGVWMYAQYIAARTAARRNIPFIISPHGMYEPWLWKEGAIKKKIYFKLLGYSAFAKANYIHAITPDEQYNLQQLFPKTKVICIPNAIKTEALVERVLPVKPYFLFLGRLHHKKGLELLIDTFHSIKDLNYDLKIAGSLNDYAVTLQTKVKNIADDRIQFIGEVRGDDKKKLYRNAHVFIAPSFSEVVGMVNLEAAMMATPVITTYQTGLLKAWENNGGFLINPNVEELKKAIYYTSKWSNEERDHAGARLRKFVIKNYSWDVVKPQWQDLYSTL